MTDISQELGINNILNSREYNLDAGDSNYAEYTASTIIENLHDQGDDCELYHTLLKEIADFRKSNNALPTFRG